MPHAFRFLLAEDQQLLRVLLRTRIEADFPGCDITEMQTLAELLRIGKDTLFDLAIIDLQFPDGNAMNWIIQRTQQQSDQRLIVLTSSQEDYIIYRALHSNVRGFVHKNDDMSTLTLAIKAVLGGSIFFSETVQKMRVRMGSDPNFFSKIFSEREQQVLELLGQGLRNAQIGRMMKPPLAETSVQDYRRRIMAKLGVHRDADLIRYANKVGFSNIKEF
jgi:DNA-binding NarL/FixJ family response regulator